MLSILFPLFIAVLVFGLIYWLTTIVPLPAPFKTILLVVFILIVIFYLLSLLTGYAPMAPMRLR